MAKTVTEEKGNSGGAAVPAKKTLTPSERFTQKVISEFGSGVGEIALTNFQRRLVGNYFISCDAAIKATEKRRKNDEPLVVSWESVNLPKLAQDVVALARIGLDPAQKNHVHPVIFKNNALNKYDVTLMEGYRGKELKAKKYGLDIPDSVTVELVFSNDKFKPIKKDLNHPVETYEFDTAFDRGKIIGGFWYHAWEDNPQKNRLKTYTLEEIEKRKPRYASVEFWGNEKVDGWHEEMCWKTIFRAAHEAITIDSQKIDEDYLRLQAMENDYRVTAIDEEIAENANQGEVIDVEYIEQPLMVDEPPAIEAPKVQGELPGQAKLEGPGY